MIGFSKDADGSLASIIGTDADAMCASACFFIWIAGVQRFGDYMLVVHRPYFDPTEFRKLSSDQAQSEYAELEKVAYSYLESMGTPRSVIDLMRRTSSNNGVRLEPDLVGRELQPLAPDIDEWLRAKCGLYQNCVQRVFDEERRLARMRWADGDGGTTTDVPDIK